MLLTNDLSDAVKEWDRMRRKIWQFYDEQENVISWNRVIKIAEETYSPE